VSNVAVAVAPFIGETKNLTEGELASAHEEARLQAGLIQVEGVASEALAGVATDGPSIVALAQENGCDLIVLAWQESRGISRRLLDATLEHVLGNAGCPVLIVKYAEEEVISLIGQEM
jgi:nucleotide-binding universal stress UspA family protein